jgi:hypothetical protein
MENVILKSELMKMHVLQRTWEKWIPVKWIPVKWIPVKWIPVKWIPVKWIPVKWIPVKWIPVKLPLDISLMTKAETLFETSVHSPFKNLTRLPAREYFVTF